MSRRRGRTTKMHDRAVVAGRAVRRRFFRSGPSTGVERGTYRAGRAKSCWTRIGEGGGGRFDRVGIRDGVRLIACNHHSRENIIILDFEYWLTTILVSFSTSALYIYCVIATFLHTTADSSDVRRSAVPVRVDTRYISLTSETLRWLILYNTLSGLRLSTSITVEWSSDYQCGRYQPLVGILNFDGGVSHKGSTNGGGGGLANIRSLLSKI